jgi:hypothetical protein
MLLSDRNTPRLFFEQDLGDPVRSHLLTLRRAMRALDERKARTMENRYPSGWILGETAPEQIDDGVYKLPVFLRRTGLDLLHQVIK